MGKLIDTVERMLFGATAEERVDMMTRLVEQRVEQRIIAALETDDGEEPEESHGDRLLCTDCSVAEAAYICPECGEDMPLCASCLSSHDARHYDESEMAEQDNAECWPE